MATPRDDISIPTCGDKALLAAFAEQDGEFYGFGLEDLETPMVIAEDSDEEDSGSENELDLGMVVARVGTNEDAVADPENL